MYKKNADVSSAEINEINTSVINVNNNYKSCMEFMPAGAL